MKRKRQGENFSEKFSPCLFLFILLENVFCFLKEVAEDILVVLLVLLSFEASKLFKQLFLFSREIRGCHDLNDHVLISTGRAMYDRHTHTLEAERAATLRPSRNLERGALTIDRWDLYFIAQRSLRKANRQLILNIVALAFEEWMGFHRQHNIQVTRSAATRTNFTFTRDAYINAIVNASGNINHHTPIIAHTALTATLLTGSSNDASFATAALTHRDID
jgi:hypothetical protein